MVNFSVISCVEMASFGGISTYPLENDPVLTEICSPLLVVPEIENSQNLENALVDFNVLSRVERA